MAFQLPQEATGPERRAERRVRPDYTSTLIRKTIRTPKAGVNLKARWPGTLNMRIVTRDAVRDEG